MISSDKRRSVLVMICITVLFLMPLGAERRSNNYFELDIPDGLEEQNETFNRMAGVVDNSAESDGSFVLILQQKGLNRLEEEAFNNYMRLIFRVIDSGYEESSNELFKEMVESSTPSELDQLYEALELGAGKGEVISDKPRDTVTLGGYFAIHSGYERQGITEEKGSVVVDTYELAVGRYFIYITTSYRKKNEEEGLPIIKSVLSSINFVIEDKGGSPVLYENTLPRFSSFKYKWPEKDPKWVTTYSDSYILKALKYTGEGRLLYISYGLYYEEVGVEDFASSLPSIKEDGRARIKEKYGTYNVKITRNDIYRNTLYIEYEYCVLSLPVYGYMCAKRVDDSSTILFVSESIYEKDTLLDAVYNSLGF